VYELRGKGGGAHATRVSLGSRAYELTYRDQLVIRRSDTPPRYGTNMQEVCKVEGISYEVSLRVIKCRCEHASMRERNERGVK
jgi:hypothetical protein